MRRSPLFLLTLLLVPFLGGRLLAEDWPQFLGPHRNGSTTNGIEVRTISAGPSKAWSRKVGHGFSGPIVAEGHLILHLREEDEEVVESWDLVSGTHQWRHVYPTHYRDDFGFDDGPRASPAVSHGQVFTFGAEGRLTSLRLSDGKENWHVDTLARFKSDKGFFGLASSPLVVGDLVMVNIGGPGAGVGAFKVSTGEVAWKLTDDEAGYASPVMTGTGPDALALFFTRAGLVAVQPSTGSLVLTRPWRSRQHASVNAASPLVSGTQIFLTASYGTGALLLNRTGNQVSDIWSGDSALSAHYATPVLVDGYLYGFHGRTESKPAFRCVEWTSGKVMWSVDGFGAGTVVSTGKLLVALLESGELAVLEASPKAPHELARAQVLGSGTRSPFALADGYLAARDPRQLVVLKVR